MPIEPDLPSDYASLINNTAETYPFIVQSSIGPNVSHLHSITNSTRPRLQRPHFSTPKQVSNTTLFNVPTSLPVHNAYDALLKIFAKIRTSLGLQDKWFLTGGTLIGSVRHHGMIPCDEDVNVSLSVFHRNEVQAALKKLADGRGLHLTMCIFTP